MLNYNQYQSKKISASLFVQNKSVIDKKKQPKEKEEDDEEQIETK